MAFLKGATEILKFQHKGPFNVFLFGQSSFLKRGGMFEQNGQRHLMKNSQAFTVAKLSTTTRYPRIKPQEDDYEMELLRTKNFAAQARLRATFYPKFENEKSDQEIRSRMIEVVDMRKGVLEVTLKHSGSLFMYAGSSGGAYAKNSFGNLYSAVGVFVLGRTLQEAWGAEAADKIREFNVHLEKNHLCISMELVTAVLGDHGQWPLKDYVVVTAVTDLKGKPRFYSTPDIIAFCCKWRLPTNHIWLFSTRKSAISFFSAYDALSEEGTATPVSNIMDRLADVSVPATDNHTEVQGEILEGLVARIVSPLSATRIKNVLKEYPFHEIKGQKELSPTLREICASKGSEDSQVRALLHAVGRDMCPDHSDWNFKNNDSNLFTKFVTAVPVDHMTAKLLETIQLLHDRYMKARFPCRVKGFEDGKVNFKLTVHVLEDNVFRKYQREMRDNPGLWPLYRGFFVDVCLTADSNWCGERHRVSAITTTSERLATALNVADTEDDVFADDSEHLMLKLKFLTYKLRTFLIRNGLETLFDSGFPAYRKYYLKLMDIWHTSPSKQQHLDQMLTEWATYITKKYGWKKLEERSYLSEAEPFLQQFAQKSERNRRLVGAAGSAINTEEFLASLQTIDEKAVIGQVRYPVAPISEVGYRVAPIGEVRYSVSPISEVEYPVAPMREVRYSVASKSSSTTKGFLVFFPGIPGCAKSALCKELLETPGGLGIGLPVHSLMGDMVKARYWPKLADERKKNPAMITLADKNAPTEDVWRTIEDMCESTNAIGVPIVPDSEGTSSSPFSLDTLAVFMFRVLQRVDHPGRLDGNSPNPGYVLLMFYNLYEGQDRREFEESLKRRFGHVVKQPVLKADRPPMPPPLVGVLNKGLDLFKRHTLKHGKLESTKGDFKDEWLRWEKRLRDVLFGNADYLNSIQVPFEEVVKSVREQLKAITQRDRAASTPPIQGDHMLHNVTYSAISLPPQGIMDILHQASLSRPDMQAYISNRGLDTSMKSCHITLAHKVSHGMPAVASFSAVRGVAVQVQFTAFLFSEKMCALEAHIPPNEHNIDSKNEWPHLTVWTAQGTRPKEANTLPKLVSQGKAMRADFLKPFLLSGVIELLT